MPPTSTSTWFPRDGMSRVWKTRRPGSGITTGTRTERMDTDLGTAVQEGRGSVTLRGSTMSLRRERTLILALLLILDKGRFSSQTHSAPSPCNGAAPLLRSEEHTSEL